MGVKLSKTEQEMLERIKAAEKLDLPSVTFPEYDFLMTRTQNGEKPTLCTENICRILRINTTAIANLRYDEFKNLYEIKLLDHKNAWRQLEDADIINIQAQISILFDCFQKVGKEMVADAVIRVAHERSYDSAQNFLTSLTWDATPRVSQWLTAAFGTLDDAYHQAVAANVLKGLVKRIMEPGCKFDYVLVLEGEQGIGKSTALAALGGPWYVETTMAADTKDFFLLLQGKAMAEFSEGESLSRTEVKRMKAIISTQIDSYRPPYGRMTKDFPRRCIFVMTTNQDEYLKDETGNRRWLPVRVKTADVEWIRANREQLLAEAYHRVMVLKETIYEFPKEETLLAQSERRIADPNTDAVVDWYQNELTDTQKAEGVTLEQVSRGALHSGFSGTLSRIEQMSIASILREVLKLEKKQTMHNGIRRVRWYPPEPLKGLEIKIAEPETHDATF